MAKKPANEEELVETTHSQEGAIQDNTDYDPELPEPGSIDIQSDFNVLDEWKPDPLVPNGTYHANVIKVTFDGEQQCLVWSFCLAGNGGVMSDGQTSVDGRTLFYRNWLPRPGDDEELTKDGKSTKRQAKINMLKQFADVMDIDVSTPQMIIQALLEQSWVGLDADVVVQVKEFEGRISNEVRYVKKSR